MDLSSAARELYGGAPAEFVARRKELVQEAKESGDADLAKAIGALRRPTLSAWAVDLLAHESAEELGWLLDVGADLRAAWASGGHIGGLEQRRSELIALLVRTAKRLAGEAGNPLRDQAVREVEDTLQAATVDEDVADEVREGHLAQPRSHSGFGTAGFGFPAAGPPAGRKGLATGRSAPEARARKPGSPGAGAPEARAPEVSELARRRAEKARRLAREAAKALAQRKDEATKARRELAEASDEVERLQRELDEAAERQEAARRRLAKAERAHERAAEAAQEAEREAAAAQI
ncbi:hypothetical protein [Spirillospora sp. NPDC047279]|uniref:hypothetical protein n=1 Tax=Spirillospora sp. NPDC047279 TaxID=3155478 RepID=UPI0033EE782E